MIDISGLLFLVTNQYKHNTFAYSYANVADQKELGTFWYNHGTLKYTTLSNRHSLLIALLIG